MPEDDNIFFADFIPVPKELHSFETGRPFANCVECGKGLLANGTAYLIQKAFKGSETLVEFAHCFDCYESLAASYSKQTRNDIWDFFLDSVDLEQRKNELLETASHDFAPWVSSCLTCGKRREEAKSYTLLAQCDGPDMALLYLPYLICEDCQIEISERMSQTSKEIWDRWLEENLDMPPSAKLDLKGGRLVFF